MYRLIVFLGIVFTTVCSVTGTDVSGNISQDTTWDAAGSPYRLTGNVQVAYGRTLTISAGATVQGNERQLQVFGRLIVAGDSSAAVSISNTNIGPGANQPGTPSSMDIRYAAIEGGSIWAPTGNAVYSSISLRDSVITNLAGESIYLWYPVASCFIERNTFIRSVGFSIGFDARTVPIQVVLRKNVFFEPQLPAPVPSSTLDAVVACWASYGGAVLVDGNSFLNVASRICLKLPAGYDAGAINAANNYWGNLSVGAIFALIFDRTKDLSTAGVISFQPLRSIPDPAAPAPPFAPLIADQSASQIVREGSTFTLSVTASGNPLPRYQWRKDSQPIVGATTSRLTLSQVAISAGGVYTAVVSNAAGTSTTQPVVLTVQPNVVAPVFVSHPSSQTATEGDRVVFSTLASGAPSPAYQWFKDGQQLGGATNASVVVDAVGFSDAGIYSVVATNSGGAVFSSSATLGVNPASVLSNLSIRTSMLAGQTLIVGGVVVGLPKEILVRAAGPALSQFGIAGMEDPRIELYSGTLLVGGNDNWSSGVSATSQLVGAFPFAFGSRDSALVQSLGGAFTVTARGNGQGIVLVECYDVVSSSNARIVNLSARCFVGTGSDVLIIGFAVTGPRPKQLFIRAVGPGLSGFGVAGTVSDPVLQVTNAAGVVVAQNDNWDSSLASTASKVGAFPLPSESRDAAVSVSLLSGQTYTVIVSGASGGTGEALVEIYEVL